MGTRSRLLSASTALCMTIEQTEQTVQASGGDLQWHVARHGRIDVAGRWFHILAAKPRADVKLMSSNNNEYDNLRKVLDGSRRGRANSPKKYYSRLFALFVLYGNVRDLVPLRTQDATKFVPLDEFLSGALFGQPTWFCTTTAGIELRIGRYPSRLPPRARRLR